jgi:hypothetical protein
LMSSVLGMPSSSTSVEHLFSGAGNVTQLHRGALSSTMVAKQTSCKVWVRVSDSDLLEERQEMERSQIFENANRRI